MSEDLLLTPEQVGLIEWESGTLNMAFVDDRPEEIKALLEAQLAHCKPLIEKQERERIGKLLEDSEAMTHTATFKDGGFTCNDDCPACALIKALKGGSNG